MPIHGEAPRSDGESRAQGRTDLPLREETIPRLLAAAMRGHGGREADDAVSIHSTSGITGLPRGAAPSHRNIVDNGQFTTATIGLSHVDRLCIPVPLHHCFGMVMGVPGCVSKGAAMVFPVQERIC